MPKRALTGPPNAGSGLPQGAADGMGPHPGDGEENGTTGDFAGVGLPVVSTRARGIQRYFSDEPLMKFSDFDGKQFGAEILNWLATPQTEIQQLAVKACARVRQELDWRVLCARAVDFCERMAKQS